MKGDDVHENYKLFKQVIIILNYFFSEFKNPTLK